MSYTGSGIFVNDNTSCHAYEFDLIQNKCDKFALLIVNKVPYGFIQEYIFPWNNDSNLQEKRREVNAYWQAKSN